MSLEVQYLTFTEWDDSEEACVVSLFLMGLQHELCVVAAAAYLFNIPIWLLHPQLRSSRPRYSTDSGATITTTTGSLLYLATTDAPEHYVSILQSAGEPIVMGGEEEEEDDDNLESGGSSNSETQRALLVFGYYHDIKNKFSTTLHAWILQPAYPLSFTVIFLLTLEAALTCFYSSRPVALSTGLSCRPRAYSHLICSSALSPFHSCPCSVITSTGFSRNLRKWTTA